MIDRTVSHYMITSKLGTGGMLVVYGRAQRPSKAYDAGYRDAQWARQHPDLTPLHGDPEFERLYPAT